MTSCLLGIGSNLGQRGSVLDEAVQRLDAHRDISVQRVSSWHESRAVGGPEGQPTFLNGAVLVDTDLAPQELLFVLLSTENALGRQRDIRWGPRIVDLDLLLFGDEIVSQPGLIVPHPWMAIRHFVLNPAAEIAADRVHPQIGWTLSRLLENLSSRDVCVMIAGILDDVQQRVVQAVADEVSADVWSRQALLDRPSHRVPIADERLECGPAVDAVPQRRLLIFDAWLDPAKWAAHELSVNLLILLRHDEITLTPIQREQQRRRLESCKQRGQGPFLVLTMTEGKQLKHDLLAAIHGMITET